MDQKHSPNTLHDRKVTALIAIRSIAFFLLYNLMGIIHSVVSLLVAPFQTFEQRYRFVNLWTYGTNSPQATILKRELLWVPFFGWALALLKPIAIDRKKASQALKTILRVGKQRLHSGISVVIYPEGTRQQPGTLGRFNGGGASLAVSAQVPIVPIVHNAGDCWPARSLWRFPGTITVVIGAPISVTGKSVAQVKQEYLDWISANYPGELLINHAKN